MNIDHIVILGLLCAYIYLEWEMNNALRKIVNHCDKFLEITKTCLKQLFESDFYILKRIEQLEKDNADEKENKDKQL